MFITVVNFKTYPEATAEHARSLALACQQVAAESDFNIMLAPQALDVKDVADSTELFVIGQHCDAALQGKTTGSITAEALKMAGASGSLLNHSEKRLTNDEIQAAVTRLREQNMISIVCVDEVDRALEVEEFQPDFIAFEPSEFIGSEISLVDGDQEELEEFLQEITNIPVLVGAGIKSEHDVAVAKQLGAAGCLIASHVVKADNPVQFLKELLTNAYTQ